MTNELSNGEGERIQLACGRSDGVVVSKWEFGMEEGDVPDGEKDEVL